MTDIQIINLQAHDVTVYIKNRGPVVFRSQGTCQVRMSVENVVESGVVKQGTWTHTRGLPKPSPNTLYIVSSLVAMFELYENNRTDLLFPWGLVKDHGKTIGCRGLCRPRKK